MHRVGNMPGILIYMALLTVISACGANSQTARGYVLKTSTIFSRDQCDTSHNKEEAVWLDSQKGLADVFADINKNIISDDPIPLPQVDFDSEGVLLVEMGQQSTSGHYISLADPTITVNGETANIVIEWHHPPRGLITASVITYPCLLLKIPLSNYNSLLVRDTLGQTKIFLDVRQR